MIKKIGASLMSLFFFSALVSAQIPDENAYRVVKRNYANEPELQRFTISAYDKAFLTKPTISSYTQLNPLDPKAIYTIPPYPHTEFLPRLGKWMTVMDFDAQPIYLLSKTNPRRQKAKITLVPAHWISLTNTRGQYIIEPINYIFIVYEHPHTKGVMKLHAILQQVGFVGTPLSPQNHTGGYYAYIGDKLFGQVATSAGEALTYSNGDFQFQNDHLRLFGKYDLSIHQKPAFVFAGAISEESGLASELAGLSSEKLKRKLAAMEQHNANGSFYENYGHHFVSFTSARNNLAIALIKAGYPTFYASLSNTVNTLGESTEDHDGNVYITVIP